MKAKRKIIEIDEERCDGCGSCVPACAEGAIQIVDGKARVVSEKFCDGLGACLGECPRNALRIVEREAEEFDEEAVEAHLKADRVMPPGATGCPSAQVRQFEAAAASDEKVKELAHPRRAGALAHWPIQIRLVPADAPFLKGADLLVAADCTPVAYPAFHREFLTGKAVLLGCPKFDDVEAYIQKFAEIFRKADISTITVLVMEVPCCQGLPYIVVKGMERAGTRVPVNLVVIGAKGNVQERKKLA